MKLITVLSLLVLLECNASAKARSVVLTQDQINLSVTRAVAGIPALRSAMIDPDSFVLENVTLKAPNKQGVIDVCYTFRSHNRMGGYSGSGTARLNSKSIVDNITEATDASDTFNVLSNPCSLFLQSRTLSIFSQVTAALDTPPVTIPGSLEDAAVKAQQYADCLKGAISNPSVVCKQ